MNRFAVALLTLAAASAASAQNVTIQAGPMGMGIHVDPGPAAEPRAATRTAVETIDEGGVRITYESREDGGALMKVLAPEGAPIQVLDDRGWSVAKDTIPVSFQTHGEGYYKLVVRLAGGVFEKKVQARPSATTSVWIAAPTVAVYAPAPAAPPPPPAVAVPVGLPDADFADLARAIEAEAFSEGKLGVIETALPDAWFTVAQVGALVDLFSFSEDQVQVVKLVRSHIVDPQNGFKLLARFTFSEDKEEVRKLLK